ncbi:MAG: pyridoxamine 5'-phosphate oxidase family protein [Ruminiclostridium sp.]|nr:pyridoxamine 5'-phosphate oxidase family protein [Ruminiclostridium sp.]
MRNEEIGDFLKKCQVFFIATDDDGQPRVRPFGAYLLTDGKANCDEQGAPYKNALEAA